MIFWFPETYETILLSTVEIKMAFLWLALFPTTVGYLTWTYTVGYYGANKASLFLYLIPPVSIILDYIWFKNEPSLYTILGGVIIILSVSLTLYFQDRKA